MSKCRPSCCPGNSSDNGAVAIVGVIVLAVAIYGIIKAIWRLVIEIVEITAITLGGILAVVILVVVAVHVVHWRNARRTTATRPKSISFDPSSPLIIAASGRGKPAQDTAELFAEAIANDMDPRLVERILNTALERHDR